MGTTAPLYLDYAATTPVDPRVAAVVLRAMTEEFGNAGSRTHEYGSRAKALVEHARTAIASAVTAALEEVIFTSGATESNNLAILGLAEFGRSTGRTHLVTTAIEHKAVLEPMEVLAKRGFTVEFVPPTSGGWVDPNEIAARVTDETLLVSVMHVNNETGIIQPLREIAELLDGSDAFFHVDAAQGFGKLTEDLRNPRIDLIGISGHKLFAPKGIGALIARRRGHERLPLTPLMHGGGQERGLRPGTLAVPLIAALGAASELAEVEHAERIANARRFRQSLLDGLSPLAPQIHGDQDMAVPNIINLSFAELNSEATMLALKDLIAISNGSACTSQRYEPSHVLQAMKVPVSQQRGAVRISWAGSVEAPDWPSIVARLERLR